MTSSPPCRRGPRRPAACSTRCWACSSPAPRSCSGSSPLPGRLAPQPSRAETMDSIDTVHDRETIRDGVRCQCVREACKMSNVKLVERSTIDPNMTASLFCPINKTFFTVLGRKSSLFFGEISLLTYSWVGLKLETKVKNILRSVPRLG